MINQKRYVDIVSGVGAGAAVAQRQFILRLITQNSALPPGIVAEFTTPEAVGTYFTTDSEEYKRAQAYFSFLSKSVKSPTRISFARWVNSDIAPMVVGDSLPKTMAAFRAVTNGTINFVVEGESHPVGSINLAAATDFAAVTNLVQTAITEYGTTNSIPQLQTATVSFNAVTNQFVFTGGVTGSGVISVGTFAGGTDLGVILGWNTSGAVAVAGQSADSADVAVQKSSDVSNNFGSFAFVTPSTPLTDEQIEAIAAWNHSQNNMYIYCLPVTLGNMAARYELLKGYSGTAMSVINPNANDYTEQSPAEILAATDYTTVNATQNYMYYVFSNRQATVKDDTTADAADAVRANYIGATQSAGQQLAFYQRGLLCGGPQDAVDMNTYANEMWLKATITAQLLTLFINIPVVSADTEGKATCLAVIQGVINTAKINGVIAQGKDITPVQQQYITQLTGDETAWRQVSTLGYWIDIEIKSEAKPNGITEYYAEYILVYAKDDAIRFVRGRDVLI